MFAYVDEILVASASTAEYHQHLRLLCEPLQYHDLLVNVKKCAFGVTELGFVRHKITPGGILPLAAKAEAFRNLPQPDSLRKLRKYFGQLSFNRCFISPCAQILQPLTDLLRTHESSSTELEWSDAAMKCFSGSIDALVDTVLLVHNKRDTLTRPLVDASATADGAVLQQFDEAVWVPLAYDSQKLNPAEARYSTSGRESLAVYMIIGHLRSFLEGGEFYVMTDRNPVTYAFVGIHDSYLTRESRHLAFISKYATDLRYV